MGRVSPPKVVSGESVSSGSLNDGIDSFSIQSGLIDGRNVRDEALGSRELESDTFISDFSYWEGVGASNRQDEALSNTLSDNDVYPYFTSDKVNAVNYNSTGGFRERPHVRITNNPALNDVSIIRVSCGIYMDDYGFQTFRKSMSDRYKGPIIRCVIADMNNSKEPGDGDRLKQTAQWFQLPWSGAKWHKWVTPEVAPRRYQNEDQLSKTSFDKWFTTGGNHLQFVPRDNWDSQNYTGADVKSPMTFNYNFHYQATYVWKPSGLGSETKTFGLMTGVTCDDPGDDPTYGGAYQSIPSIDCTDGAGDEAEGFFGANFAFRQPRVDFPGYYIRNLTMNATTYRGGR